ncbi:FtsW/RodA/SpoVE family cell cycle protein, partial [Coprococcus eutactus]|uniref:FtsW/RodA/SpoVE family cell cycle protein n=1 Tax=Coprococcus eutactus TaxID=33043 RepID=UPI00210E6D05
SGGLFCVGDGKSVQKIGFIPESLYDMIFSVVCEELGMVGAISLIVLFIVFLY